MLQIASVKEVRGGKCPKSDEMLNLGQVSWKKNYFNFKIFDFKMESSPQGSVEESESDIINVICRSGT